MAFDERSAIFPGACAALPAAGACLLIVRGPAAVSIAWCWRQPLAVFVGLISYPLYLWHWPLLSFLSITQVATTESGTAVLRILAVAVSVALAYATWKYVEGPIRTARSPRFAWPLTAGLASVAGVALAMSTVPTLSTRLDLTSEHAFVWPPSSNYTRECHRRYGFASHPAAFCLESRPGHEPEIVLIGDSNGNHWMPGIVAMHPGRAVLNVGAG